MIYTDTVAVLPAYARAAAADLRASSERWRQYQEPPSCFDDALGGLTLQMSPAAREAYQDESVLGRALKVSWLNAWQPAACAIPGGHVRQKMIGTDVWEMPGL